ncbi:MAG: hypothetical protein HY246_23890 [Proteobacteria bacterium]|nr:hypothetical protein [Pseudomonadota bacterium]
MRIYVICGDGLRHGVAPGDQLPTTGGYCHALPEIRNNDITIWFIYYFVENTVLRR